jgi:hypothetical protein
MGTIRLIKVCDLDVFAVTWPPSTARPEKSGACVASAGSSGPAC